MATKTKTKPKPERVITKYKANRRWVMLIEYRQDVVDRQYQKFLFKTDKGGILTATKEAERLAKMVGKALCLSLKEIEEATLCRVVGVYAEDVFKSWSKETGTDLSKTHVKEAVKLISKSDTAKIKKIGVR